MKIINVNTNQYNSKPVVFMQSADKMVSNRVSNQFVQKPDAKSVFTFCGKGMAKLNKMLREDRASQRKQERIKEEERKEKERLLAPLPEGIAKNIGISSNPFDSKFTKGKQKALSIAYNIRTEPVERLFFVAQDGEILHFSRGGTNNVGVLHNDKFESSISLHNHPVNASFSPMDIKTSINMGIRDIMVSTKEGFYTMILPEGLNKDECWKAVCELDKKFEDYRKPIKSKFDEGILEKKAADKQLYNYLDQLWQDAADKLGWQYSFTHW